MSKRKDASFEVSGEPLEENNMQEGNLLTVVTSHPVFGIIRVLPGRRAACRQKQGSTCGGKLPSAIPSAISLINGRRASRWKWR
jgi:hypothetical protein